MRKSAVLLVGVLGVFIFLGVLMIQSLVIVQRIASVSEIAGEVFVKGRSDTNFRPLADQDHVLAGYTVRTGPAGAVTLNWVDGSRVRLGPETSVRVRKCSLNTSTRNTTSLFDLDVGRIWVRVLSTIGGNTKFEVRTPTATAGVRGTVFYVEVAPEGETSVAVYEGEVEVAAQGGTTASVTPGSQASVAGSSATVTDSPLEDLQWSEHLGIVGPRLDLAGGELISVPANATSVAISGISEPGATVTINGSPVELDRRNRFTVEVPIAGEGLIVVSATDYRGGSTVRAVTVERETVE